MVAAAAGEVMVAIAVGRTVAVAQEAEDTAEERLAVVDPVLPNPGGTCVAPDQRLV